MGRVSALVGSAILHVAIGGVLFAIAGSRGDDPLASRPAALTYEVAIAVPHAASPAPIRAEAGGGAPTLAAAIPTPGPASIAKARTVEARTGLRTLISGVDRPSVGDGTGDGGSGGGRGGGRGTGIGLGSGSGVADLANLLAPAVPPPPPPPSLARPPRLIWPSRKDDVSSDLIFIIRVKVDTDGFVDGVELVRGRGGPPDEEALSLIWKFRYEPALDDDGRPITATIEQSFAVNR